MSSPTAVPRRTLAVSALGVDVQVVAPEPAAAALAGLLVGLASDASPTGVRLALRPDADGWTVLLGVHEHATAPSWQQAALRLLEVLNATLVAGAPVPAIHAGVVERGGRCLAFPAVSGAGKSTFTAALLQHGWSYVSDEALVVDEDLVVTPYRRPLMLSTERVAALSLPSGPVHDDLEQALDATSWGAAASARPLVLTDVVLLDRRPGAPRVERLAGIEAAAPLLANCFNHYLDPRRAFSTVSRVAEKCAVWKVSYTESTDVVALVTDVATVVS